MMGRITEKQKAANHLINVMNFTYRKAAARLKISVKVVYAHVQKYKANMAKNNMKLELNKNSDSGAERGGVTKQKSLNSSFVRVHGLHFVVYPYYCGNNFYKLLKQKRNVINQFFGWRIEINKHNIEVISLEETSFTGKDRFEAFYKAFESFNRVLRRLENRLSVGLIKNDYMNIRLCKQHIAIVKDGVALSIDKDKDKYIILYNQDGEAWFMWDKSKKEPEWETVHSITAKLDYDLVNKYIGDFQNNPLTNSQITSRFGDLLNILEKQKEINEILFRKLEER